MSNPLLVALPLVLFVLLALTFLLVLRRAARIVAQTREMDGFRRTVGDLSARITASLAGAGERIDAVRRGQVAPDTIREALDSAREAVEGYRAETEALVAPAGYGPLRARLVEQLDRAARAFEMVDHGCATLTAVSVGRARGAEGQTAIKRGYLNLLHAREAVVEVAAALRSSGSLLSPPRWYRDRSAD